tara:strand:- start:1347 stop:1523 length:177 start_codon:yes stop_codon:yes gene_type:complete
MKDLIIMIWFVIGWWEGIARRRLRKLMGRKDTHNKSYIPGQVSKIVREMESQKKKKTK